MVVASIMSSDDIEKLRQGLLQMRELPAKVSLTREDWLGALAVFAVGALPREQLARQRRLATARSSGHHDQMSGVQRSIQSLELRLSAEERERLWDTQVFEGLRSYGTRR